MQEYPVGTIEYFVVDVTDRLDAITTLNGYTITFDVKFRETQAAKYTAQAATNDGMKILCLIDTNHGGAWAVGPYQLWVTINATPESPRLGPFEFKVV